MNQLISIYFANQLKLSKGDTKRTRRILGGAAIAVCLMFGLISYNLTFGISLKQTTGNLEPLPVIMAGASSLLALFSAIYSAKSLIFAYKDRDMLAALPLPRAKVVLSRVLILYIYELIYTFAIMLPCLGVCAALTRPGFTFWLTAIPGCIMLPVLPLVIGCALGAVGAVLTSGSRAMGAMRYVLITVFALGLMAVSFSSSFSTGENGLLGAQPLALIGRASSAMRRYWPPLAWFSDAVWKYPIRLLLLAAVSVAGLFAFTSVAGKYDGLVADRVASVKSRGGARLGRGKARGVLRALLVKEFATYTGAPLYVFNTAFGLLLMLIASGAFLIYGDKVISVLVQTPGGAEALIPALPLALGLFAVLSCTSACSVSMEGSRLWISRMLPVSRMMIFTAKMGVNFILSASASLISSIMIAAKLGADGEFLFWLIVTPLVYSAFTSAFGLFINLRHPKLDWTNEAAVVKQSAAVLLAMLGGFLVTLLPLGLQSAFGGFIVLRLATVIIAIFTTLLLMWMKRRGAALYDRL